MQAILKFNLPDDQADYDAARLGRSALCALWDVDQHCRSLLRYGEPTPEARELAEAVRRLISDELLET
jgi:hypothetical protein